LITRTTVHRPLFDFVDYLAAAPLHLFRRRRRALATTVMFRGRTDPPEQHRGGPWKGVSLTSLSCPSSHLILTSTTSRRCFRSARSFCVLKMLEVWHCFVSTYFNGASTSTELGWQIGKMICNDSSTRDAKPYQGSEYPRPIQGDILTVPPASPRYMALMQT